MLVSFDPKHCQNEIRSGTSVLYDKHIYMFWLNSGDWKLGLGPFIILLKWKSSKIWPLLIAGIYHF